MNNVYAGFWKRFAAAIIDFLILVVLSALMGWVAGFVYGQSAGSPDGKTAEAIGNVTGILVWWVYYATLESSARQATVGKLALGIKVVDLQGGRISFGRATGRHFSKILSGLIVMIGYLMAGFTAKKQALHDMMAGCLVVNRAASGQQVAQAEPAARMPAWAIVLVVLGVIVLPLAIIAAVVVPAYQDMTIRARVRVAFQAGNEATMAVSDFYLRNKSLPRDIKEAGMSGPLPGDVRQLNLDPRSGTIEVVLAMPALEGKTIRFTPRIESDNRIVWTCSSGDIREGYLPARCRK